MTCSIPIKYHWFARVNLPPEAQPATVLEMDETDGMSNNQQRRVKAESYVSETYETKNSVAGANNKSKESLSPLATSEDLVDEELANMENAESLDAACKKVSNQYSLYINIQEF